MAEISFNFRNIVDSKKCAFSSPRIVGLEIGDESPDSESESIFSGIFCNEQGCCNDVKNNSNLICGFDKQSDNNFSIHSQSTLSAFTCDDRPYGKIKSSNGSDIDLDLLDLLNSADFEQKVESVAGNLNSKKTTSNDKMKIISNIEACDGSSNRFSSIAHDISEIDEGGSNFESCLRKNTRDCDIGILDFEIVKNEHEDLLPSNNSLKVEGNLSDILSSINIEDSDVLKVGSLKSMNMCNSKVANKSKIANETPIADLSDLLSCINIRNSNDHEVDSCNHADMKILESKNESCFADLLSSINIGKSNKPAPAILNSRTLSSGNSNLYFKDTNVISDSSDDFAFDLWSCSSSNSSCASSDSEKEINSSKDSSPKNNLLTDKAFASDSGCSSFDSVGKEFSFFDYSSDNQFSINTLFTKKSGASIAVKNSEDIRNSNEEMSMSDLMTIVSPEFKCPVLATLNKAERLEGNVCKDSSDTLDLMEDLNINGSHVVSNNSVEEVISCDCIDGKFSKNVQSVMQTINKQGKTLLKNDDTSIKRSDFVNDDEQVTFIDLRECIKSTEHQFTPPSPIKQHERIENQTSECLSLDKILSYSVNKSPLDSSQNKSNPFEFNDVLPRKKSRVNTKQTLFSQALACKPKKDNSLFQKVASVKSELLNNFMHRPVFIDCDLPQPIVESVLQSDRCILSNVGRRSFGLDAPCELQ